MEKRKSEAEFLLTRILLVDDEEDFCFVAKEFLSTEEPSFKITTVSSALDALQRLEKEDFDIVVSDYQMPNMDGLELLENLRSKNIDIPFIMFTGRGREEVAIQALNLGANYYIRKGSDTSSQYAELAHVIRSVVRHKLAVQKLTRADKELSASEEKYRDLVEKLHEGVLVEDGEGIITFVNPRAMQTLGYSEEELIGNHWSKFVPNTATDRIKEESKKRFQGISSTYETVVRSKVGRDIPVIISATPLWDNTGGYQGALSVFMDISDRKQMEEELQINEAVFRRTFEAIPDPAYLWERNNDGDIVLKHANKASYEITRGMIADSLGFGLEKLHKDEMHVVSAIKNVMNTNVSTREEMLREMRTTGEKKWLLVDFVRTGEGSVLVISKDITEQKRAELYLEESEARYKTLFHNAGDAIFIHDFKARLLEVNQIACDRLGYSREELLDKTIMDIVTPENSTEILHRINMLRQKGNLMIESVHVNRSGTSIPVEVSSQVIIDRGRKVVLSIARDITKRKKTEKELAESLEKFRVFADHSPIGIVIQQQRKIIYVNKAILDIFGYKKEEILSRRIEEFYNTIHPEDQESSFLQYRKEVARAIENIPPFDFRVISKSGENKWVTTHTMQIELRNGPAIAVSFIDITERKRAEELLRRQKDELSKFAHIMAHDIRNSLTSIQGFAEIIENEYDKSHVQKIRDHAIRMNKILDRSLDLADAGLVIDVSDDIDINELVSSIAELTIPENVTYSQEKLPTVACDREKVGQIFKNIFENAMLHGDPKKIGILRKDTNAGISILIANDGNQIHPENREKIFSEGFTTRKGSMGLGLALVKNLVEAHGWQISLDSSPETTFRILIPVNPSN